MQFIIILVLMVVDFAVAVSPLLSLDGEHGLLEILLAAHRDNVIIDVLVVKVELRWQTLAPG